MRRASDGAIAMLFQNIVGESIPRDENVTPPSVETKTSLGAPLSEVLTQIAPSGPSARAAIERLAIRPGSPGGSSAVAVAKLQPPSWLIRRPVYVVAKIVPSPAMAYA